MDTAGTWNSKFTPNSQNLQHVPACGASGPVNVGDLERWVSGAVGAGLVAAGLLGTRKSPLALLLGAALVHRGATGNCMGYRALGINTSERPEATGVPAMQGFKIEETIAIQKSPEVVYNFWRDLSNLPQAMQHLESVEDVGQKRSHWVAKGPLGLKVEWDAEIINERENELIAWRSLPGGDIDTAGSIHFRSLGENRGTAMDVSLKYNPPGGKVGATIASLLGQGAEAQICEDLKRFKGLMETGQAATPAVSSSKGATGSNKPGNRKS